MASMKDFMPLWMYRTAVALRNWTRNSVYNMQNPSILVSQYVFRILLFRVVMLMLSLYEVDQDVKRIAELAPQWTTTDRGLMLALVVPIVASLAGLAWPCLSMRVYEQRHKCIHKFLLMMWVASRVALQFGGRTWMQASPKQHFILDAFLHIVLQDSACDYAPKVVAMMLAYYLAAPSISGGVADKKFALCDFMQHGEFYVSVLFVAMVVSRVYEVLMGRREQAVFLRHVAYHLRTQPQALVRKLRISESYLWKLCGIKAINALTLLHYSRLQLRHAIAQRSYRKLLNASISGMGGGALAACVFVAILGHQGFYRNNHRVINALGLGACLCSRAVLLLVEGTAGSRHAVFHSYLAVVFSLVAHEEPFGDFAAQIATACVAFRGLQAYLSVSGDPALYPSGWRQHLRSLLLGRLEFVAVAVVVCCLYRCCCIGIWTDVDDEAELDAMDAASQSVGAAGGLRPTSDFAAAPAPGTSTWFPSYMPAVGTGSLAVSTSGIAGGLRPPKGPSLTTVAGLRKKPPLGGVGSIRARRASVAVYSANATLLFAEEPIHGLQLLSPDSRGAGTMQERVLNVSTLRRSIDRGPPVQHNAPLSAANAPSPAGQVQAASGGFGSYSERVQQEVASGRGQVFLDSVAEGSVTASESRSGWRGDVVDDEWQSALDSTKIGAAAPNGNFFDTDPDEELLIALMGAANSCGGEGVRKPPNRSQAGSKLSAWAAELVADDLIRKSGLHGGAEPLRENSFKDPAATGASGHIGSFESLAVPPMKTSPPFTPRASQTVHTSLDKCGWMHALARLSNSTMDLPTASDGPCSPSAAVTQLLARSSAVSGSIRALHPGASSGRVAVQQLARDGYGTSVRRSISMSSPRLSNCVDQVLHQARTTFDSCASGCFKNEQHSDNEFHSARQDTPEPVLSDAFPAGYTSSFTCSSLPLTGDLPVQGHGDYSREASSTTGGDGESLIQDRNQLISFVASALASASAVAMPRLSSAALPVWPTASTSASVGDGDLELRILIGHADIPLMRQRAIMIMDVAVNLVIAATAAMRVSPQCSTSWLAAEQPRDATAMRYCLLPALSVGCYLACSLTHLVLLCWQRTAVWAARRQFWCLGFILRYTCAAPAMHIAMAWAALPMDPTPLTGLQIVGSGFAVLGMGEDLCHRLLPAASGLFYIAHAVRHWNDTSPLRLLLEAALFLLLTPVSYAATFGLYRRLLRYEPPATVGATGLIIAAALIAKWMPALVTWPSLGFQMVAHSMQGLDIELVVASSGGVQTAKVVVLLAVPLFIAVAVVQSVLLRASSMTDPRSRWYTEQHERLLAFMDSLISGDQSDAAIITALREATDGTFDGTSGASTGGGRSCGGGFNMDLVILEGGVRLDDSAPALVHPVHRSRRPKAVRSGRPVGDASMLLRGRGSCSNDAGQVESRASGLPLPKVRRLPLSLLHSAHHALTHQVVIFTNDFAASPPEARYEDWETAHQAGHAVSLITVPLLYGGCDLGALLVSCPKPGAWDEPARKLLMDFGLQISQTLYTRAMQQALAAGDAVLTDIMPSPVVESLKRKALSSNDPWVGHQRTLDDVSPSPVNPPPSAVVYKEWHPAVSVIFADIAGYTNLSQQVEPEEVMMMLHDLYTKYDTLCAVHDVYKVETIGDCWMGATGLLEEDPRHASAMVTFARDMFRAAAAVRDPSTGHGVRIRVGIHSGRVMSGIVGSIRARYCLFGDTVNTASRMESTGVPGHIQISASTFELLDSEERAHFKARGAIIVKGKGELRCYLLAGDGATVEGQETGKA